MASEMEEPSPEDEEEEQLGWSWKYTMICVVLPLGMTSLPFQVNDSSKARI